VVPGISLAAHLGGLVVGAIAAVALVVLPRRLPGRVGRAGRETASWAGYTVVVFLAAVAGVHAAESMPLASILGAYLSRQRTSCCPGPLPPPGRERQPPERVHHIPGVDAQVHAGEHLQLLETAVVHVLAPHLMVSYAPPGEVERAHLLHRGAGDEFHSADPAQREV